MRAMVNSDEDDKLLQGNPTEAECPLPCGEVLCSAHILAEARWRIVRTSPTAGLRYDRPAGGSGATPLAPLAVAARTCARTSHPR